MSTITKVFLYLVRLVTKPNQPTVLPTASVSTFLAEANVLLNRIINNRVMEWHLTGLEFRLDFSSL
jgi:hypothetical protein